MAKKYKTEKLLLEVEEGSKVDGTQILYHIPFSYCGDESTLCGIMFDSGEFEGIYSFRNCTGDTVTCHTCIEMLGLVKIVAKSY